MGDKASIERLDAFIDQCIADWPLGDGLGDDTPVVDAVGYDLTFGDLRDVLAKARTLEVVDLARVAVKPGDTLLVRPRIELGFIDVDLAIRLKADLERQFPGVKAVILGLPAEVAVIEGAEDAPDGGVEKSKLLELAERASQTGLCPACPEWVYLEDDGRIGFHPIGEDGNQCTCPGAGRQPLTVRAAVVESPRPRTVRDFREVRADQPDGTDG